MLAKVQVCLLFLPSLSLFHLSLPSKWRIGRRLMWKNSRKKKKGKKKERERERKEFREDNSQEEKKSKKVFCHSFHLVCCCLSSLQLNTNFLGFLFYFLLLSFEQIIKEREREREREMEETTNKREPWPTGLFDCCSGSIFFFFSVSYFLLLFFFNVFLCFYYFERRRGGGCEGWWNQKHFTLSFQYKINFFLFSKKEEQGYVYGDFSAPVAWEFKHRVTQRNLHNSSSTIPLTQSQLERYPPLVLSWYWPF